MEIRWKVPENRRTRVIRREGVEYLEFSPLKETEAVLHGFTTRLGGVSRGVCSSMNLSFTRGDRQEDVRENYRRIARAVGFSVESIVCSDQTHTTNVRRVGRNDCGSGIEKPRSYQDVDGLITDESGVTLATFYADCVPLYLVDPVRRAIGLSHSGWRGTVGKIGKVTVEVMEREFGCRPENILTVIGPSICMDCYEVSGDVAGEFLQAYPEALHDRLLRKKSGGKISAGSVGSLSGKFPGGRDTSGAYHHAGALYLLQSFLSVFPQGLRRKKGQSGGVSGAERPGKSTVIRRFLKPSVHYPCGSHQMDRLAWPSGGCPRK